MSGIQFALLLFGLFLIVSGAVFANVPAIIVGLVLAVATIPWKNHKGVGKDQKIIVSACLAGFNCRYNGTNKLNDRIKELVEKGEAIPVCPEQLGGMSTPRIRSEQEGEKVFNKNGEDVTEYFLRGANEVLRIAILYDCKEAILKSGSPSCGCGWVYDGSFTGTLKEGDGVTANLLKANGIKVYTEENFVKNLPKAARNNVEKT